MIEEKEDHDRMVLNRRLSLAQTKLAENQYEAAQKLYVKCIDEMQSLEDLSPHVLRDAKFNLFHAYRNQRRYTHALKVLHSLTESSGISSAEINLVSHLKAETYLQQGKPKAALIPALEAMRNRYGMSDVNRHLYMESSNLVAAIYKALNQSEEAELYKQLATAGHNVQTGTKTLDENGTDFIKEAQRQEQAKESTNLGTSLTFKDDELLNLLSQEGLTVDTPEASSGALIWAIRNDDVCVVHLSIRRGADVNYYDLLNWTPLNYAAASGSVLQVELLIKLGANVNGRSESKWTPLMTAVWVGNTSIVKVLIGNGAKLEEKSADDKTALQIAKSRGHVLTVDALKEAGAMEY